MSKIQEQTRSSAQTAKAEREPEKKPAETRTAAVAPEIASAAVAAAERALGYSIGAHSGERLLSGGNQFMLGLLKQSQSADDRPHWDVPEFSADPPENNVAPGTAEDNWVIPDFSGRAIGITDLSSIS